MMLGYINQLVEHNNCKVIVLANEKEIGKITLNSNLEKNIKLYCLVENMNLKKDCAQTSEQ